jgi:hypothetical protein
MGHLSTGDRMSRANEPAYPVVFHNTGDLNDSAPNGEVVAPGCSLQLPGLTKREHFAAMAMQGILSTNYESYPLAATTAKQAIEYADALLAELAKERT